MKLASVKVRGFWLADVSADWVVSNAQARQETARRDEKGIEERRREERERERVELGKGKEGKRMEGKRKGGKEEGRRGGQRVTNEAVCLNLVHTDNEPPQRSP